ncbi:MAG: hypothetical protein AAF702_43800 [Chloroflexota bacterium]
MVIVKRLGTVIKWLLALPLIFATVVVIFCVWSSYITPTIRWQQHGDEITAVHNQVAKYCGVFAERDREAAYDFMAPSYKENHSLEDFVNDMALWDFQQGFAEFHKRSSLCDKDNKPYVEFNCKRTYAIVYERRPIFVERLLAEKGFGIELRKLDNNWYYTGNSYLYYDGGSLISYREDKYQKCY